MPKKRDFQSQIAALKKTYRQKLKPALDNYANRYTIFLPIFSESADVFAREQIPVLQDLIVDCCGGLSQTVDANSPPWQGIWLSGEGEPIVDYHILLVVYGKYSEETDQFFRRLKAILEQQEVASQDIVVIEKMTIQLLAKSEE